MQFDISSCANFDGYLFLFIVLYAVLLLFDDISISQQQIQNYKTHFYLILYSKSYFCTPCSSWYPWFFAGKIIFLTSFLNSFNYSLTLSTEILSPSYSKIWTEFLLLIMNGSSRIILHLERRNTSNPEYKNASWTWFCGLVTTYSFVNYSSLSNFSTLIFPTATHPLYL